MARARPCILIFSMSSDAPNSVAQVQQRSAERWEQSVYALGLQVNQWPFSDLVAGVMRELRTQSLPLRRVLEVGCGVGNNLWFLATAGFDCAGIDQSPTALALAGQFLGERGCAVELVQGDLSALPWPDQHFDLVVDRAAVTCNTHERIHAILEQVQRVLRPGGIYLGYTYYGMAHPERVHGREVSYRSYDHFCSGRFAKAGVIAFFEADDLTRLFAGFAQVQVSRVCQYDAAGVLLAEEYHVRAVRGATR